MGRQIASIARAYHRRDGSEALPSNAELAAQFDLLADLLELDGADVFRLSAYRRASARIRESAASVAQLALDGTVTEMPGIGSTIDAKIVELVETGDLKALAKLRDKVPAGLVDVMHVPGLGPKTARRLWEELGVTNLDELRAAAEAQKLRELSGLGREERGARARARSPSRQGVAGDGPRRCSAASCRSCARWSPSWPRIRPATASPRRAASAAAPRPRATST